MVFVFYRQWMIRGNDFLESFRISCSLYMFSSHADKNLSICGCGTRRHYAYFPELKGIFPDSCKSRVTKSYTLRNDCVIFYSLRETLLISEKPISRPQFQLFNGEAKPSAVTLWTTQSEKVIKSCFAVQPNTCLCDVHDLDSRQLTGLGVPTLRSRKAHCHYHPLNA